MLKSHGSSSGDGRLDSNVHWIDLFDPTPDEIARVAAATGIVVPSRESLQEIETSSRLRAEGQILYVSMPLATLDRGGEGCAPVPLGFVLSPEHLVTVRYSEIHAFGQVETRIRANGSGGVGSGAVVGSGMGGSGSIFVAIMNNMVDYAADMLEKLSAELAAVSAAAFHVPNGSSSGPGRSGRRASIALRTSLNTIGLVGDQLSRIRESLLGLQRIVGFVQEMAADWLLAEHKSLLGSARADLVSLVDFEGHLSGKTQFLLDAVLGFISTEQNDIFKVLTIVSVVGVPPTLIASMYGMNFHDMPELSWHYGYPYGLALITFSAIVPILWFKRRGWW